MRVATSALSVGKATLEVDVSVKVAASLTAGIINGVLGCLHPVLKLLVKLPLLAGLLLPIFATLNIV